MRGCTKVGVERSPRSMAYMRMRTGEMTETPDMEMRERSMPAANMEAAKVRAADMHAAEMRTPAAAEMRTPAAAEMRTPAAAEMGTPTAARMAAAATAPARLCSSRHGGQTERKADGANTRENFRWGKVLHGNSSLVLPCVIPTHIAPSRVHGRNAAMQRHWRAGLLNHVCASVRRRQYSPNDF